MMDASIFTRGRQRSAKGLTVVITGASAGVGRVLARRFGRAGAKVALIARDAQPLEETRAEIDMAGGTARCYPLDVSDAGAVMAAAERIEIDFGPIAIWINNAMVTVFSPVHEISPEEFRRVTDVTYLGFVHGTMAALRRMRPRNHGVIVQIGSALSYRGIPLQSAYCGAKHAIRGFTDSLRAELRHENSKIKLSMVHLPAMNTPQFDWARTHMRHTPRPVPPVAQPEAAARAVFATALNPRRELWVGLSTLKVIFGNMVAPGFLDGYLARKAYSAQETDRRISRNRRDNLMQPVTAPHRGHGSFGGEARDEALIVSGRNARLAVALIGVAAIFVLAGMLDIVHPRFGGRWWA